ncbi:uncharacterized protein [Scyliorhinus torazame]|uniref:uncharacterized protein n=1 Tax=Scyliorhinus torazame TaxID=75743 RepID=UPI003B5A37BF
MESDYNLTHKCLNLAEISKIDSLCNANQLCTSAVYKLKRHQEKEFVRESVCLGTTESSLTSSVLQLAQPPPRRYVACTSSEFFSTWFSGIVDGYCCFSFALARSALYSNVLECGLYDYSRNTQTRDNAGYNVTLMVTQSPPHLSVMEGDTATMNCRINSLSLDQRIEWMETSQNRITKVLTSRGNTTRIYPNYAKRAKHFLNDSISILSISRINLNDTGVYVCEVLVEIPGPVNRKFGNGTHLHVQVIIKSSATSSNDSTTDSTRWVLISCISSITLIVSVTTFFLARRLMKKDEPVYVNVKYRNKAGQNYRPTEQRNVKYTTSSSCGDVKTVN